MPAKRTGGIKKRLDEAEVEKAAGKKPRNRLVDPLDAPSSSAAASSSSTQPLPGGIRNRLARAERDKEDKATPKDLPLTKTMKQKWGKGRLSAKDVAEVFDAASKQGASDIPRLSSLNNPQNLHRSLTAAFGHPVGAPDFFWSYIPLKGGPSLHPFLLPHMWFATLFSVMLPWWEKSVRGPVGAAAEYWEQIKHTDFFTKHPVLVTADLPRTIPIGLH